MKTEIQREYNWGFVLSEQELRRIAQSVQEHAAKLGAAASLKFTAKLKDGSLIESNDLDDVLSLENGGQKAVTRLTLRADDGHEPARAVIQVQFEDGLLNPARWTSIAVAVVGESRDAVFVAAADLDDRIKKTRTPSWPYIVSRQWFFMIPLLIGIGLSSVLGDYISGTLLAVETLEREYAAGRVTNPIQALILLERLKATRSPIRSIGFMAVAFGIPMLVFGVATVLIPKLSCAYVFYWGDAIARYDKRKNVARIFWTVVVLGIVASTLGGLVLRVLKLD